MKSSKSTSFAAITLLTLLILPLPLAAQGKQNLKTSRYTLTVLGTLGGTTSVGNGLNTSGSVAGFSTTPGDSAGHAVLWIKGAITDLGSLGGNTSTTDANPNAKGDLSGYSNLTIPDPNGEDFCFFGDHLECLAFLSQNGTLSALPTLGGNNSLANQLNDLDQVAGVAENTTPDPSCEAYNFEGKPVVWHNGIALELPTISGDPDGFGYGINDRGQIVGSTGTCNALVPATSLHAVLWPNGPNGGVIDLGNLGGPIWNIAFYINNQGQVVGQSGLPGLTTFHAFLWTKDAGMKDLGTLPGDIWSWANNINNNGQAVGTSFPAIGSRAFLWQNGVMTDLNTLIPAGSLLYLLEAFGINDRGQISGFGQLSNGELRGYLLNPCGEEHGNGEGCGDNAAGTAKARVSPPPVAQKPAASTIGTRMPGGMLNRFRFPRGRRNSAASETEMAPDQNQQPSTFTVTREWKADDVIDPLWSWHHGHSGYCEVDMNGNLDGSCVSHNFQFCYIQPSANCPKGQSAASTFETCGGFGTDRVALKYPCSF